MSYTMSLSQASLKSKSFTMPSSGLEAMQSKSDFEMKRATKTCYSSFFSVYFPDFKNVFFTKNPPAPSEVSEDKWAASRSQG